MVQYVFTPWRDRRELLRVRRQFYPDKFKVAAPAAAAAAATSGSGSGSGSGSARKPDTRKRAQARAKRADVQSAVARVSVWVHRGHCPHMVESTALLAAAVLGDEAATAAAERATAQAQAPEGAYAARAAYAAAFSRFVTGLLDSHQDKQRKMSMYAVARTLGLPAAFVELRHQATHEQLPSLGRLRAAARRALAWIWEYYWKHLAAEEGGVEDGGPAGGDAACRAAVVRCLGRMERKEGRGEENGVGEEGGENEDEDEDGDEDEEEDLAGQIRRWGEARVLRVLAEIGESTLDHSLLLRTIRLSRSILSRRRGAAVTGAGEEEKEEGEGGNRQPMRDIEQIRAALAESKEGLQRLEEEEDVAMEEAPPTVRRSEPEEAGGSRLWTKYEGAWKPRPIGVV